MEIAYSLSQIQALILQHYIVTLVLVDYDGDSIISVSDASTDSTRLYSDSSSSNVDISVQYKGGLKCLYTNIDCISNKWTELEALIYLQQPDIVGITEVFPKNQDEINLSAYTLEGFQQFVNPQFCVKNNRGTILFARSDLDVMLHDRLNNSSSKEACWCIVGLNKTEKLLIGLVYRSPNSTEENNVLLNNMMSSLNDENFGRIVVMGDFNYRDIDWSLWTSGAPEDHSSHGFIEAVRDSFMYQHVTFNTRFRENQSKYA